MNSKIPTAKQTAWISLIPHTLVLLTIWWIWWQISPDGAIIYGTITYLLISNILRRIIARHQRRAMKYVQLQNFETAIPLFQKSYEFFKRNEWVDKYRYLTLLTSSGISYREIALNNIAFCYGQMGNGQKAREYYERTLEEFPNSGLATTGLNMLNALTNSSSE